MQHRELRWFTNANGKRNATGQVTIKRPLSAGRKGAVDMLGTSEEQAGGLRAPSRSLYMVGLA
jgi:hypothetical protein